MNLRILLVEDEPGLVMTLSDLLTGENYDVEAAADGPTGQSRALSGDFDLMILDVMLPGKNGFDVCRELRQQKCDIPILMLTAKSQVVDRVVGLKLGADDYLAKPFDPAELLARIEAVLRRSRKTSVSTASRYQFGNVSVDFEQAQVSKNGEPVSLAGKELQLLRYLIEHRGKVVPREQILESVWQYQAGVESRTVDVHVAWLRQKLEDNPQSPRFIHTVRGIGYRFSA